LLILPAMRIFREQLTMKRTLLILLNALTLQLAWARPNIVLILADDVGCEPIGAYGGERWKTPHIDALAEGGMRFDYCFSMPVCHPTRVCLLTGRYPFRLKAGWGTFPRAEETHTLAAVLRRAGYRTAIAGKWQLCLMNKDPGQPARMGFDEWSVFGWHEGARYHEPMIYQNGRVRGDTRGKYGPELYVEFLGDFMERSSRAKQPFFACYSMALAHDVTNDIPVQVPYVPGKDRWMNYGEMIESMDVMVGRLVARIDQLGLREDTVIFFTGDNGTAARSKLRHVSSRKYEQEDVYSVRNGQRVRGGKGTLLDIGTNVPLIVKWPGKIMAGSRGDELVDFSDWLPTLAEIGGAKLDRENDGISFSGTLFQSRRHRARSYAFSERKDGRAWVRSKQYKLYNDDRYFDVRADPMEQHLLKDVTGRAAEERDRLEAAFVKLNYPGRK
jgi:arylsulfatase A|tara:strand:- start:2263 stop:3591 length:1329 start_codon:yes stop_codon:yes gene_type:complete